MVTVFIFHFNFAFVPYFYLCDFIFVYPGQQTSFDCFWLRMKMGFGFGCFFVRYLYAAYDVRFELSKNFGLLFLIAGYVASSLKVESVRPPPGLLFLLPPSLSAIA